MMKFVEETFNAAKDRLAHSHERARAMFHAVEAEVLQSESDLVLALHEVRSRGVELDVLQHELKQRQVRLDECTAEISRMRPIANLALGVRGLLEKGDCDSRDVHLMALQELLIRRNEESLAMALPEVLGKPPSCRKGFDLKVQEHLENLVQTLEGTVAQAEQGEKDLEASVAEGKQLLARAAQAEALAADRVRQAKRPFEVNCQQMATLRKAMFESEEKEICFDEIVKYIQLQTGLKKPDSYSGAQSISTAAPDTPPAQEEEEKLEKMEKLKPQPLGKMQSIYAFDYVG